MIENKTETPEILLSPTSGWPVLGLWMLAAAGVALGLAVGPLPIKIGCGVAIPLLVLVLPCFYVVEPNMCRVLVLFGNYKGSVRENGLFWTNPFMTKKRLSLRAHNFDGETIKVNDLLGNPIEISAVVVWRIEDSARAVFDVEDFEHFVRVQSDAALRSMATSHPYDKGMADEVETTLRGSTEVVAQQLEEQLAERLKQAGVKVLEARLNHLAYAPEIASAMLQRQQAKAIVSARQQIVEGAVGMVEMALAQLSAKNILELDDERRATLVGNLLVVLCGQANPSPVINTGSLYT